MRRLSLALAIAAAAFTSGCATIDAHRGTYVEPIGGAVVIDNDTPYSVPLRCLATAARAARIDPPVMAVGQIADYTGKYDEFSGYKITQGAALMVMSALAKAGLPMVERFDTSVAELELKYANNKLLGDDTGTGFRKVMAGSIPGSRYHVIGGITELNFNIRSQAAEALIGPVSLSGRYYVLNVALDLRVVDSASLEVIDVVSYQKQIIGRELRAGFFEFLGGEPIDLGAGDRSQEPIQLAVRMMIERAALDLSGRLYGFAEMPCQVPTARAETPHAPTSKRSGIGDSRS